MPLDAEAGTGFFQLTVTASDGTLSRDLSTFIFLNDVNDNAPVMERELYQQTVPEDIAVGASVVTVTATDADTVFNQVQYSITSGDDLGQFSIGAFTGAITVAKELDYENITSYSLIVRAADDGDPQLDDTAAVLITVEDKNDNDPRFAEEAYAMSVSESASAGTVVLNVSASDADSGNNGRITFRIVSVGGATSPNFEIDDSGVIRVLQAPDRDPPSGTSTLQLIIRATDNGAQPRTTTAPLTVTILDENDNTPVFGQGSYAATVPESLAVGQPVLTVTATDVDAGDNGRITYTLDDSSDGSGGFFQIASTTGAVTLARRLNFENATSHTFTVTASDNGASPRAATTSTITITVTDVNDNDPIFTQAVYSAK